MPDKRTRVPNISPYSDGHTPFAALYTTPDKSKPNVKIKGILTSLIAHIYGHISAADPIAPKMNTGFLPIRSDSAAKAGIAASATTLARTRTVSIVERGICIVLTAYDNVNTLKIVLTTDTNAAKITRMTFALLLVNSIVTGAFWDFLSPSLNAGVSGKVLRTHIPTATTTALKKKGMRHPQNNNCSSGKAEIGRNTKVAKINPACVPLSVKLVKNARRCAGACSSVIEFAPACSPAADKPCSMRSTTNIIGAAIPI